MPDWGIFRARENEVTAANQRRNLRREVYENEQYHNNHNLNNLLEEDAPDSPRLRRPGGAITEQLCVFQSQELQATGEMYFKVSRFQRSKRYHAELRGSTIVVFKSQSPIHALHATVDDVMSVLPVHEYKIDVIEMNDDGSARIYIVPVRYHDTMVMFIRVTSEARLRAWRQALTRIKTSPTPDLTSLTIESVIGRGGGGKVFVVNWPQDGGMYALKAIDKKTTFKSAKAFRHVASERMLMEQVGHHPFLLQMQFAFQSDKNLYIGTPFCPGGDLASYIRAKGDRTWPPTPSSSNPNHTGGGRNDNAAAPSSTMPGLETRPRKMHGRLSEEQTRRIAAEVILGLEHLHRRGIVYRDLKPENVFIDADGHIRIGDYGLAKMLSLSNCGTRRLKTSSICGTRNYLPPEMLYGELYSFETDVWSLGVMLYRMLVGIFPFDGRRTKDVFSRIKRETISLPRWLSSDARGLLEGLLEKDPEKRLTLAQIKRCAFFCSINWEEVYHKRSDPCIHDLEIGTTVADALENFELSKLQGITVGEYVNDRQDGAPGGGIIGSAAHRMSGNGEDVDETRIETPTHRRDPRNMMVGFEYAWAPREEVVTEVQPIAIRQKSGGLLSKLSSIEYEHLPISPRSPFQGAGK